MSEENVVVDAFDVKDLIVLIRSKEPLEDSAMNDMSERFKKLGALEVIFAMGEFHDVKFELIDEKTLKLMGLCKSPNHINGKTTPKKPRRGKASRH